MGEQGMMLDPGFVDWPDGGGEIEKQSHILPNKRTWTLFVLALMCFLPVVGWINTEIAGLSFVGALLFYAVGTYTWYNHREETKEREKVLDTIETI